MRQHGKLARVVIRPTSKALPMLVANFKRLTCRKAIILHIEQPLARETPHPIPYPVATTGQLDAGNVPHAPTHMHP